MSEVALHPRGDSGSDDGILQGLVNKLTPDNFDLVVPVINGILEFVNMMRFVEVVVEKAMLKPTYCDILSKMCEVCYNTDPEEKKKFRKALLNRCQAEFESGREAFTNQAKELSEDENSKDDQYQKDLKCRRFTGLMKFIGMLYNADLVSPTIIKSIIFHLLGHFETRPSPEDVECCSTLIRVVGKKLSILKPPHTGNKNYKKSNFDEKNKEMGGLFALRCVEDRFVALMEEKQEDGQHFYEPRVRFLMQDVLDLKARKWRVDI